MTMTAPEKASPAAKAGADRLAELVHYTPDQVVEMGLLPFSARVLKAKASKREIPHSNAGNRITFRLAHIRAIQAMHEVPTIGEQKRRTA